MARGKSKSHFALLGILAEREASGYELRQFIAQSIGHFWQESFGQIYPALKNMEKKGWINSVAADLGMKTRRRHRITPKGRKVLATWLAERPTPEVIRNELLLKIFFAAHAGSGIITGHLKAQRLQALEMQKVFQEIASQMRAPEAVSAAYWRFTLDYGQRAVEAELQWLEDTLAKMPKVQSKKQV